MQDAIILYENGKAIGGEGHPTNASDITFDNTGTDLVSENVENAIKEVDAKTQHGWFEVWTNSSPTSAFAGQNVDILTDKTIDDFMIDFESQGVCMVEVGGVAITPTWVGMVLSAGYLLEDTRTISASVIAGGYRLTFSDNKRYSLSTYRTAPTSSTENTGLKPYRILALVHND